MDFVEKFDERRVKCFLLLSKEFEGLFLDGSKNVQVVLLFILDFPDLRRPVVTVPKFLSKVPKFVSNSEFGKIVKNWKRPLQRFSAQVLSKFLETPNFDLSIGCRIWPYCRFAYIPKNWKKKRRDYNTP